MFLALHVIVVMMQTTTILFVLVQAKDKHEKMEELQMQTLLPENKNEIRIEENTEGKDGGSYEPIQIGLPVD